MRCTTERRCAGPLGENLGESRKRNLWRATNSQRVVVETMGLEPTTPCLQTVRLRLASPHDLGRSVPWVAYRCLGGSGRVAQMWPEPLHSTDLWVGCIPPLCVHGYSHRGLWSTGRLPGGMARQRPRASSLSDGLTSRLVDFAAACSHHDARALAILCCVPDESEGAAAARLTLSDVLPMPTWSVPATDRWASAPGQWSVVAERQGEMQPARRHRGQVMPTSGRGGPMTFSVP
jgi:hypothetical protein